MYLVSTDRALAVVSAVPSICQITFRYEHVARWLIERIGLSTSLPFGEYAYHSGLGPSVFGVPLVATVHATERGRHGGHLPPGLPGTINSVEWWLTYQARTVIACSRFMVREVLDLVGLDQVDDLPHLLGALRFVRGDGVRNQDCPCQRTLLLGK